jgi:hypothetical protein
MCLPTYFAPIQGLWRRIGSQRFLTEGEPCCTESRSYRHISHIFSHSPLRTTEIWNSHGGDYEDPCRPGCDAVRSDINLPTFQIPPYSGLPYTAEGESQLYSNVCKFLSSIPCHILPEDGTLQNHWQILNLRVVKKLKQYEHSCIHCKMFTN